MVEIPPNEAVHVHPFVLGLGVSGKLRFVRIIPVGHASMMASNAFGGVIGRTKNRHAVGPERQIRSDLVLECKYRAQPASASSRRRLRSSSFCSGIVALSWPACRFENVENLRAAM